MRGRPAGRSGTCSPTATKTRERWRRLLKATHAARAEGLSFTAQIAGRPIGVMMGIGTALNPFTVRPSYKKLESLPIEEQRKRLRDPEVRRQILAEQPSDAEVAKLAQFRQAVTAQVGAVLHHGQSAGL